MAITVYCRCYCTKVCHISKDVAQHARNMQRKRGMARDLEVYQCLGGCWHLSHRPFKDFDENGKRFRK